MERISTYLRLRTAVVLAALPVAAAVMMAVCASANASHKDVTLRVVNNTTQPMAAEFCRNGDVSFAYQVRPDAVPCNFADAPTTLAPHGGRVPEGPWPANPNPIAANPIGVVVRQASPYRILDFYVKNPAVGLPFFMFGTPDLGHGLNRFGLVQGELRTVNIDGFTVRFHREGDTHYKVMTIELCEHRCTS